ncbi:hypothetical protein BDA99DRAFT_500323, partial [Phascolomyces articulosus]
MHVAYFMVLFFFIVLIDAHLVVPYIFDVELLTYMLNDAFKFDLFGCFCKVIVIMLHDLQNAIYFCQFTPYSSRKIFIVTRYFVIRNNHIRKYIVIRNNLMSAFINSFVFSSGFID